MCVSCPSQAWRQASDASHPTLRPSLHTHDQMATPSSATVAGDARLLSDSGAPAAADVESSEMAQKKPKKGTKRKAPAAASAAAVAAANFEGEEPHKKDAAALKKSQAASVVGAACTSSLFSGSLFFVSGTFSPGPPSSSASGIRSLILAHGGRVSPNARPPVDSVLSEIYRTTRHIDERRLHRMIRTSQAKNHRQRDQEPLPKSIYILEGRHEEKATDKRRKVAPTAAAAAALEEDGAAAEDADGAPKPKKRKATRTKK